MKFFTVDKTEKIKIDKLQEYEATVANCIRTGKLDICDYAEFCFQDTNQQYFRLAEMHRIIHGFYQSGLKEGYKNFAVEAHIDSGKTQQVGIILPTYSIGMNRNIRVGIACASGEEATGRVNANKRTIESNRRYHLCFPDIKPSNKWTESYLRVEGTVGSATDPTLRAGSLGSSVMGSRFDLLVLDDPCDANNSLYSKHERLKTIKVIENNWLSRVASGTGIVFWIGTPWHEEDAMRVITRRKGWYLLSMPVKEDLSGIDVFINGEYIRTIDLWKERSKATLEETQMSKGEMLFNRGWFLKPFSSEETLFKHVDKIVRYNTDPRLMEYDLIVGGVDLSTKKRPGTVMVLSGIRSSDKKKVIIEVKFLKDPIEIDDNLYDWKERYPQIKFVTVENNAIQDALVDRIIQRRILPIRPFTTGRNKMSPEVGLLAMDVEFNNSMYEICIPHGEPMDNCPYCRLLRSFKLFPEGEDDPVMATWFTYETLKMASTTTAAGYGEEMDSTQMLSGYPV